MSDLIEATIIQSTLVPSLVAQSSETEAAQQAGQADAEAGVGADAGAGADAENVSTGEAAASDGAAAESATAQSTENLAESADAAENNGSASQAPQDADAGITPGEEAVAGDARVAPDQAAADAEAAGEIVGPEAVASETTIPEPIAAEVAAGASGSGLDLGRLFEIFNPLNAPGNIQAFIETGGNVLLVIMIATFVMWALIVERVAFFSLSADRVKKNAIRIWSGRQEHKSWYAHAVRDKLISEVDLEATRNISLIKGLVGVAPLLGLLGTVTGMITVFDVMAITGSSNARLMAAGISKATIPTMAGLVTSLFGIAMMNILDARARRLISETADELLIK